jgi:predicted N-acyltransferase
VKIDLAPSLKEIPKAQWDSLVPRYFPFASYEFLLALETSQSVGLECGSGWIPQYVTAWKDNELQGAIVLYIRYDSYGEYIFDWDWAEAYARNGREYYPKLVSAIPYTPATGHKILLSSDARSERVVPLLLNSVDEFCKKVQGSSVHYLFIQEEEIPCFQNAGYIIRKSFQYHWVNKDYDSFEDFLIHLRGKKAARIRKERREVRDQGFEIQTLTGPALNEDHARIFYQFYLCTIDKKMAIPYLTEDFFRTVFQRMPNNILLLLVTHGDRPVAGALSFFSDTHLYGRYWGALADYKFLHFELCYYREIEFAIQNGITTFEAGAQGEHKIQRGFLPELTYSAHRIESPEFSKAIERYVVDEARSIEHIMQHLNGMSPYRAAVKE